MEHGLHDMKGRSLGFKLQYLWDYYKLPLAVILIFLIAGISILHHELTKKTPLLYVGVINVAAGEDMKKELTDDFVSFFGASPRDAEVVCYSGLYLTDNTADENYRYSSASEIKILGSIDAEKLDVVITDRVAFEAFEKNGYLFDAEELVSGEEASAVTDLASSCRIFRDAGYSGTIFLGVIKNTPRAEAAREYIRYLLS